MSRRMLAIALVAILPANVRADEFDRLEGRALADLPDSPEARSRKSLSYEDLGTLPPVLEGIRTGLVIAETDQGNPSKLLVAGSLRKPPTGQGDPIPVLLIERYATFEAGPATSILSRGRQIVLFDGFQFDLDTGQVVPEGHGGDIRFTTEGGAGPRLEPVGEVTLYTLSASPLDGASPPGRPSAGSKVVSNDFNGRYRLVGDGRWSGVLDLEVNDEGVVNGRFRSDQTGTSYRVAGQVQPDAPNHVAFAIEFPRSRQEYDARLWTEGKGALAGTVNLLERTFGFFAVREGSEFAPPDADLGSLTAPSDRDETEAKAGPTLTITLRGEAKYALEGKAINFEELSKALKQAVADHPGTSVLIEARPSVRFSDVDKVMDGVREAGIENVRFRAR